MSILQKYKKVNSFGKVYKEVFMNTDISIKAKALYAYLYAYAGKNRVAYPNKERICNELGISENTLNKYLKQLIAANYITKKTRLFHSSKYVINELTGNYGVIEKEVMANSELNINAKAMYAYISSFSGNYGSCVLDRQKIIYHLNISSATFTTYIKDLAPYIDVERMRNTDGTLSNNNYTIKSRIKRGEPVTKKTVTKICGTYNSRYNNSKFSNLHFITLLNNLKNSLKKRKYNKYRQIFQPNSTIITTDDGYMIYVPLKSAFS